MNSLFHVASELPAPLMLELQDGRIQCVEALPLPPFVARFQLALAEERLSVFLAGLDIPRLRIEPAVVLLAGGRSEAKTHSRIRVGQYFTAELARDLNLEGDRLLALNDEHLFVTESLKAKLQAEGFEYLKFTEGLSEFAANAT
jgi:hypothetical protein